MTLEKCVTRQTLEAELTDIQPAITDRHKHTTRETPEAELADIQPAITDTHKHTHSINHMLSMSFHAGYLADMGSVYMTDMDKVE